MQSCRRWVLVSRPQGIPLDSDFQLVEGPVPNPGDGEFLVKLTHLSFDPTQRSWLLADDAYVPSVQIGEPMRAVGIGQVIKSNHPAYKVGQLLRGAFGWQEYSVSAGETVLGPVRPVLPGVSPEAMLGVFGTTGLTAYFGMMDIGKPKADDTVLVSGAAGATGSVAVQMAKALGCKVIGIAGGPTKCSWVVGVAGADACIDYKSENVSERIAALAPGGVNVVFENVGGAMLEAALLNLALGARIVLCGGISDYNSPNAAEPHGIRPYLQLIVKRARMEGFVVLDYAPRFGEAISAIDDLINAGKLKTAEDVQHGFENCPRTFRRLFEGRNLGKQLLKVCDLPLPVTDSG